MPHISKENILELSSMSNEVKAYLEKLYPECFKGMSDLLKNENSNVYNSHNETPLEKAKRLYCKGTIFVSMFVPKTSLHFKKEPKFRELKEGIYDYVTGYVVFDKYTGWAEIIEP